MTHYEGPESTNSSGHGYNKGKGTGRSLLLDGYSRAHGQYLHEPDGFPNHAQGSIRPMAAQRWTVIGSCSQRNEPEVGQDEKYQASFCLEDVIRSICRIKMIPRNNKSGKISIIFMM
jgi:hypothetical protein